MQTSNKKCCIVPFTHIEVHPDGSIYTCCPSHIKYSIGNINKQSFEDCWNSKKAINIRKQILKNNYSCCNLKLCSPSKSLPLAQLEKIDLSDLELKTIMEYPKLVKFCHDGECNAKCITCRDEICRNSDERMKELDAMIETHYLPILKNADIVCVNGMGDPLASRHGRKLIKAIVEKYPNIKFDLHTNGILCSETVCSELGIADKLSTVEVSIHSATEDTYNKIVRAGNFNKVIENVKWLHELKKAGMLKAIHLIFVVHKLNYKEMSKFVEIAKQYDAKAFFWEYRPWGSEFGKIYDDVAVFNYYNPEYEDFIKMLKEDIFSSANCELNPYLKQLSRIEDIEAHMKDVRRKRFLRKLFPILFKA